MRVGLTRLLANLIDQAHRSGQVAGIPHLLAVRSDLCFRTGHWAAALADGAKGEELSREISQQTVTCYTLIMRAHVDASRLGRSAEAIRRCQEAVELSSSFGCLHESVHSAVGFVELTAGRFPEAIAAFEVVRDISESEGLRLITATPWVPDLVEAYVHVGRIADAKSIVKRAPHDSFIQGDLPSRSRSRCRGLVAEGTHDEHFELALAHHAKAKAPFETARTELVFGERLRREGRRARTPSNGSNVPVTGSPGWVRPPGSNKGTGSWPRAGGFVPGVKPCFPISQCKRFRWPSSWPEGRRAVRQEHSCS